MKTIKFLIATIFIVSSTLTFAKTKAENDTTACFLVSMDCMACKQKIEKNIAFEKGVKTLDVNLAEKTVKVKYNKQKNKTPNNKKAPKRKQTKSAQELIFLSKQKTNKKK